MGSSTSLLFSGAENIIETGPKPEKARRNDFMAQARRKDKARTILRKGEGQRNNGTYYYRWQDRDGKRHYLYAKTLPELREQEKQIEKDKIDGIKGAARNTTVNDLYELWKQIKRGLRNTTFENYTYMYDMFASRDIGTMRISNLKKSDVKIFYNRLADEKGLRQPVRGGAASGDGQ